MEDLLRSIAGNAHLRSNPAFVNFLMPDEFITFTESNHSEVVRYTFRKKYLVYIMYYNFICIYMYIVFFIVPSGSRVHS